MRVSFDTVIGLLATLSKNHSVASLPLQRLARAHLENVLESNEKGLNLEE